MVESIPLGTQTNPVRYREEPHGLFLAPGTTLLLYTIFT